MTGRIQGRCVLVARKRFETRVLNEEKTTTEVLARAQQNREDTQHSGVESMGRYHILVRAERRPLRKCLATAGPVAAVVKRASANLKIMQFDKS